MNQILDFFDNSLVKIRSIVLILIFSLFSMKAYIGYLVVTNTIKEYQTNIEKIQSQIDYEKQVKIPFLKSNQAEILFNRQN